MHCWSTWIFTFVRSFCCMCLYIIHQLSFKPLRWLFDWKTQIQMCVATRKTDSNPSRHYLPPIRASNGWINKALFRVVFGKGIVPAVQPLGPWLELRESTLCNTPGGYEEQMSCLLLSSSRLKAAHTSLKMTSWKVEPQKVFFFFFLFCMPIFGRWLAVSRGLKRELICCRPRLLQPGLIQTEFTEPLVVSYESIVYGFSVSKLYDYIPRSAKFAEDRFWLQQGHFLWNITTLFVSTAKVVALVSPLGLNF